VEGTLGWLGKAAQEKRKVVQESIGAVNSEELIDKAWSGVKTGVKASSNAAHSASDLVARTATDVVHTKAVTAAASVGKSVLVGVGSTVIHAADTVISAAKGPEERVYPNRALGGTLLIEISGAPSADPPGCEDMTDLNKGMALYLRAFSACALHPLRAVAPSCPPYRPSCRVHRGARPVRGGGGRPVPLRRLRRHAPRPRLRRRHPRPLRRALRREGLPRDSRARPGAPALRAPRRARAHRPSLPTPWPPGQPWL